MWNQLIMWTLLIVPWFSVLLMRGDMLRRYTPVALLTTVALMFVSEHAYAKHWWVMTERITPGGIITNTALAFGTFFIGTIWIFRFVYRSFWLYFGLNAAIDALQIFVFSPFLFEGRLYTLDRISHLQVYFLMLVIAVMIYVYQRWQERIFKPQPTYVPGRSLEFDTRSIFRKKAR
ncbi:hypothetical protein FHS18_004016 [Paenibacillus phyllosphaerae]|uniref:Uncharacterized protein n=1 Tax=Paenibacillus phyllosphaerae TaxID=274593 RepID=A0A7W5B030_9BACL|nr:hypothetical protein [Paenibacillus phyllosphaerae]MBB3111948.1 hypothetical protein [Paenibacillus phyllosphaerae]